MFEAVVDARASMELLHVPEGDIITSEASRGLGIKVGEAAAGLIKATEVTIIRPPQWRP